jgi:hypothetical protein
MKDIIKSYNEKFLASLNEILSLLEDGNLKKTFFIHIETFSNYFQLLDEKDFQEHFHIHEPYWKETLPDCFEKGKKVYYSSQTYRCYVTPIDPIRIIQLIEDFLEWAESDKESDFLSLEFYITEELEESVFSFFGLDFEVNTINNQRIIDQLIGGLDYTLLKDDISIDYEMQEINDEKSFLIIDDNQFDFL